VNGITLFAQTCKQLILNISVIIILTLIRLEKRNRLHINISSVRVFVSLSVCEKETYRQKYLNVSEWTYATGLKIKAENCNLL